VGSGGEGGSAPASSSSSSATAGGSGGEAAGGSGTGGDSVGGAGGDATGGSNVGGGANAGGGGGMMTGDADGDGWTVADGDCCDSTIGDVCDEPAKVNPGAFEYIGNGVDDDCDSSTPEVTPDCSGQPLDTPTSSIELAKAMDLCQFTTENPPLPQKKWGIISTSLVQADGTATAPKDLQVGVLADYGQYVMPKKNATMAAISSGTARAVGDPGYVHPQNGSLANQFGNYNAATEVGVPPAWLAANGGALPPPATCPACVGPTCTKAYDSVNLKLRIRVPTNALSFSYNFKFYTAEYPEFVCQQFNDFFVTLLTSNEPSIPADKNIAFDGLGNAVSVNNGFLDVCFPGPAAPPGSCPWGTVELLDNGMGGWGTNEVDDGGATIWLTNDSPVIPGEVIDIEFITWDAGDHNVDSLVLLDNFRFKIVPSQVGTHE
jgi:hypothetical protein